MKFTKKVTALAMALSVTAFSAHAATGIVATDGLNIRSAPSVSSSVVGRCGTGSTLEISEYLNGWYKVSYGNGVAYVSSDYVSVKVIGEGLVNYNGDVYLRSVADWDAAASEKICNGTELSVTAVTGDFYEILYNGNIRYIPAVCTNVRRDTLVDREIMTGELAQCSLQVAAQYLGTPYVYGGTTPAGFDCSGFTMYVYSQLGISLPHSSKSQASCGIEVSRDELLPGDLVFFNTTGSGISHVGIYAGNGMFIHSPLSGSSVCYSSMNTPYYTGRFVTARRVAR